MNDLYQNIRTGLAIIRKEGINFSRFKHRISAMITSMPNDEDYWVMHYQMYAEDRAENSLTVEEWAEEMFKGFNLEEHRFMLKKNTHEKI